MSAPGRSPPRLNPACLPPCLQLECPGADNITFPGSPVSITTGGPGSDIPASYVSSTICTLTLTVADALGSAYTEAVSLEVQPAASPPPDCSLAVFTPPMLASRTVGQVCAANKVGPAQAAKLVCVGDGPEVGWSACFRSEQACAELVVSGGVCAVTSALTLSYPRSAQEARRGQIPRLATNVVLSLTSAQGQNATINITDIVFNKATAGWQCEWWTGQWSAADSLASTPELVPLPMG